MNVVVLKGTISSIPVARELPGGTKYLSVELTTVLDDGSTAGVPVAWYDPRPVTLDVGDVVTVVGHIARRFFRSSGLTQSRTEVIAATISSDPADIAAALTAIANNLTVAATAGA